MHLPQRLSPAASSYLDLIRAVAAIAVLIEHWRNTLFIDWPWVTDRNPISAFLYFFTRFGHEAVVVFFVLSGYLVGSSALRSMLRNKWSWKRYLTHRLVRLEIVLLPALIACLVWDRAGIHIFANGWTHLARGITQGQVPASPAVFFGNIAFLQMIFVPTFGSNTPLWSLANEFWYYILFPGLLLFLARRTPFAQRLLGPILLICMTIFAPNLLLGFVIWLMGFAVFCLSPSQNLRRSIVTPALLVSSIALVAELSLSRANLLSVWGDLLLGICFSTWLYFVLQIRVSLRPRAHHAATRAAGMSYTLYLVHMPILIFFGAWVGRRWEPDSRHVLYSLAFLAVTFFYAYLFASCTERHTDSVRKMIESRLMDARS